MQFTREELTQFILNNKDKLLSNEKKHKKNYIKKPQKDMSFDKCEQVKIAFRFSYLGMNYKGLVV